MANFFAELKRRNIYRVGAVYAVVAWVLLQLAANVAPILDLPPWIARTVLLLLVIGFPVALVFAWVQQLAPESGPARASTGKLDWFIAGALVLVIALVSYEQLASSRDVGATESERDGVATARTASATQAGAVSIAVLPFANLSSDPEQGFFSDGMTEEITGALAKIADLRVVARTSAFQFKGENKDMRAVGLALGATHLIEGSVRKAGTRVRITAQLIKTDDGTHIWTENYDRELTDVFAIQEDIATAISGALRMPLGLAPGERLVANRSIDPESYQQYLRAKPLVRLRAQGVPEAIKILEPLVARNPNYAPAWALLASAYGLTPNYHRNGSLDELRRVADEFLPKGEAAARRAIQLDPGLADGYASLARVQAARGKYLLAEDLNSKALALDPDNPDTLTPYSNLLAVVGRLKEALAMKQKLRALEPFVPSFTADVAETLWLNGQNDDAIAMLKGLPLTNFNRMSDLAMIYTSMGRYGEAADILQEVSLPSNNPNFPPEMLAAAARLLRAAPMETNSPQSLPRLGRVWFVYLHVGASGRALDYYEYLADAGFFAAGGTEFALLWHTSYAPLRKTERFKALMRNGGYVEYWRAKGWPEFCRPMGADDFVCN
jgi:TolB-like protein/tetratricopeptide (TPR) repeat protein